MDIGFWQLIFQMILDLLEVLKLNQFKLLSFINFKIK